jgi:DNA (cytosine-5)-methyltransferase 1
MRIGGLFSGYGGLEMAARSVFGGTVAWHSEIDPAASKILARHWPDVPNLGDITTVDWTQVEPVDVLTGGSPCQDVSAAGKRAGMRAGTRSGLWAAMTDAIDALRPPVVVWENVRGVLSAEADSALEPCPGCVGDMDDGAVLRALGRVLGDLSDLGYDCEWHGLRAADIGAPHGRFRVFVVAEHSERKGLQGRTRSGMGRAILTTARCGGTVADTRSGGRREENPRGRSVEREGGVQAGWHESASAPRPDREPTADTYDSRWGEHGWPEPVRAELASVECGRDATPDSGSDRCEGHPECDRESERSELDASQRDHADGRTATDANSHALRIESVRELGSSSSPVTGHPGIVMATGAGNAGMGQDGRAFRGVARTEWGQYEPAIRRWERTLGRVAPAPTELAPKGGRRLSPAFVEWMMGLPAGHVTAVPGISRNDQLKALGNGVVPQQGAAAIRVCLNRAARAA